MYLAIFRLLWARLQSNQALFLTSVFNDICECILLQANRWWESTIVIAFLVAKRSRPLSRLICAFQLKLFIPSSVFLSACIYDREQQTTWSHSPLKNIFYWTLTLKGKINLVYRVLSFVGIKTTEILKACCNQICHRIVHNEVAFEMTIC